MTTEEEPQLPLLEPNADEDALAVHADTYMAVTKEGKLRPVRVANAGQTIGRVREAGLGKKADGVLLDLKFEPGHKPDTIGFWLSQLPDGYRERALVNTSAHILAVTSCAGSVAEALCGAFTWDGAPEGYTFWKGVNNCLMGLWWMPPLPTETKEADNTATTKETPTRVNTPLSRAFYEGCCPGVRPFDAPPENDTTEEAKETDEEKTETTCNHIMPTQQNEQPELPLMAVEIDDKTLRQLIPLVIDDPQQPRVNARHLHEFLRVGKVFGTWITDRIGQYDLVKGQDYWLCFPESGSKECGAESGGRGGHNAKDYLLTVAAAKELSMVERNDQGKRARRYFINCEEELKRRVAAPVLDVTEGA